MLNLILHVTLPTGLRLLNGAQLAQPVTFDILSACSPFYASVDQVKLAGGPLLRNLQDITIACAIYNNSKESDLMLVRQPTGPGDQMVRFQGAQNQWVQATTARELLLNAGSGGLGAYGSHVLANFSVTKQKGFEAEGLPERLKDLKKKMSDYAITIRSGGKIGPGGHVKPVFAAKGVYDWQEKTPGRNWVVTGMGANSALSSPGYGSQGRGKAVHFFGSPMFTGMMTGFRNGIWQSGMPFNAVPALGFPLAGAF